MSRRYASYLLALGGIFLIIVRFEMLPKHAAPPTQAPSMVPSGTAEKGTPTLSAPFPISESEKQAWRTFGGIPITFDLENVGGRTNEAFGINVSGLRVDSKSVSASTSTSKTLITLLDRLQKEHCLRLKLDMPGMQFSPSDPIAISEGGVQWNLWTDKKGTYIGQITASITCQTKVVALMDPKVSRFKTEVNSPLFDRETILKAGLEFIGPIFTLPVLIEWLKKLIARFGKKPPPESPVPNTA